MTLHSDSFDPDLGPYRDPDPTLEPWAGDMIATLTHLFATGSYIDATRFATAIARQALQATRAQNPDTPHITPVAAAVETAPDEDLPSWVAATMPEMVAAARARNYPRMAKCARQIADATAAMIRLDRQTGGTGEPPLPC